jgi:sec-independent protein translocase protein TatA
MFGSFGWMELLLILFIVLIIFGAGKIPQLGEGLGKAIKGFKKSVNEPDAVDVTPVSQGQEPQPTSQQGQLGQPGQSQATPGQSQSAQAAQPVHSGSEQPKQG